MVIDWILTVEMKCKTSSECLGKLNHAGWKSIAFELVVVSTDKKDLDSVLPNSHLLSTVDSLKDIPVFESITLFCSG